MKINHHLDEATLVSYAAGAISQSMALVIACHISMCQACRERVANTESIGGMLLESLDDAEINDSALENLLSRLDDEQAAIASLGSKEFSLSKPLNINGEEHTKSSIDQQLKHPKNNRQSAEIPKPLQYFIGDSLDAVDWKSIVPGICYFDLPCKAERGGVSRLMRIAPGKSMLLHTHDGNELTLILRGSIADEVGRFRVGDIADLDSDIEHQPLVDSDEECICLVATDAPLKFKTLLGKIVQPITGF